jgi:hypothetical protein
MRNLLLSCCALFLFAPVLGQTTFGQTTEVTVSLNSGLFSFAGRSATSNSFVNSSSIYTGYTNNPYGSRSGLSYGLSIGAKHVIRRHLLLGVDGGYEVLRSIVHLEAISGSARVMSYPLPAHGQTTLASRFITIEPYLGYRLTPGKITLDLTGGLDLGFCPGARETGTAVTENDISYHTSVDRKTISMDVRPRLQLTAGYRKTAVYIGYSLGLINYMSGYVGGPTGAYARLFRFGIAYRLL